MKSLTPSYSKLKGFPAKVASKRELIKIVTRLISQVTLQHAAVNYPLVDYAKLPITPLKLYHDPRTPSGRFTVHNFPNAMISAVRQQAHHLHLNGTHQPFDLVYFNFQLLLVTLNVPY